MSVLRAKKKDMEPTSAPNGNPAVFYTEPKVPCSSKKSRICFCCKYPSPIILHELNYFLDLYPNFTAASQIREGFTNGFKLGFQGVRHPNEALNLKSALNDPPTVLNKLKKEIGLGRMAGPFENSPLPNLFVSPIGLVPKAEHGKFRLIHHLSYPEGGSINDGINREICSVHYAKFDDAVNLVVKAGRGAHLAKADIESAFRLLPVHPDDFELLGIKFQNMYYIDKALPMGASCSPAFFEMFSTFLEWAVKYESNSELVTHYVDDFCFVGDSDIDSKFSCQRVVDCFEHLCTKLGVPLARDKSVSPTSKLTYLGLEIDALNQTISIPSVKLASIVTKVQSALNANILTLRNLQSLIGSLSFVCKAISPGRAFLRRLIDLTRNIKKPWHRVSLSKGAISDLKMWLVFMQNFNGRAIIPEQFWREDTDLQLFTDASGAIGFGGYFQGKWFQGKWPWNHENNTHSIAWMEFLPIVVAIVLWSNLLSGMRIIIRSDNSAVVSIINKQSSKCPVIMRLVRFFVLQCLKFNVTFTARHIPGLENNIADSLSRFQVNRFLELAPEADAVGTAVPEFIWKI